MNDPMHEAMVRSHRSLGDEIDASAAAARGHAPRGEVIQKTDAFLIHACRHVSSVCTVILPAARRHLPDGKRRVKEYVHQLRRLERAIAQAKGRLYGQSRATHVTWAQTWAALGAEFVLLMSIERLLVGDLSRAIDPQAGGSIASRLAPAEAASPTRAHPNSPHTGPFAAATRRLWTKADAFWDDAEGRIVSRAAKIIKRPARLSIKS